MKVAIREDNTLVYLDSPDGPYHVCSKDIDPYNKYDLDELLQYAEDHPEDVVVEPVIEPVEPSEEQVLLDYLASTGWYIERLNDPSSGKPVPEDVLVKRAAARERISILRGETP